MKKTIYYLSPFVLIPAAILLLAALSATLPDKRIMPVLLYGVLIFLSAGIGYFSPSRRTLDVPIALLCAAALILFMFLANYCDQSETYTRFDFAHARRITLRTEHLILYAVTACSALLASLKPIRNRKQNGGDAL